MVELELKGGGYGMVELVEELRRDRWKAHQVLFRDRHPVASGECHERLIGDIYDPAPRRSVEGFRGVAKSTLLEEAAVIRAGFGEFRFMVVMGASYGRACDRLGSIKREILSNELVQAAFGMLQGSVWQEGRIVLSNNCCIQAMGRDQSMLGMRYEDSRPDAALVDDVEDPEEVRTDLERAKTWDWFMKTFIPSLDHPLYSWVRVLGTRRGNLSLPERLEKAGWPVTKIPIEYLDGEGRRRASWPAKFPLADIDQLREVYRGDMHTYAQEYMCEASSAADRVFRAEMIRVEERVPSWQAVYAMVDPARTVGSRSATTGWAVWSWIGPRLIVWGAGAERLLPDEIIELVFRIFDTFDPVWLGVEEDGLNEWLRQPMRTEMAKRGVMLPFRPIRAPRNKHGFISGLQPYFAAGEVIFAQDLPVLRDQLLSFGVGGGEIDAPNALAYALLMRPAAPIYEGFGQEHIDEGLSVAAGRPLYLVANASRSMVVAALCQEFDGCLRVYADWVEEGGPDDACARIYGEASVVGNTERLVEVAPGRDFAEVLRAMPPRRELRRQPVRWIAPRWHKDRWQNVGLLQAVARLPAEATVGGLERDGKEALVRRFGQMVRGVPAVVVSGHARWTLRALAGGYTRALRRGSGIADEAEEGPYRLLMEGIESFAGMRVSQGEADSQVQNYGVDRFGNRYESVMPMR